MTNEQLCEYIKDYLEKDKTSSAIMLKGDWGTGKSYFIENTLKPYLEGDNEKREKNDKNIKKYKCVVVSLYGLKDISEISKCIFWGSFKCKNKCKKFQKSNIAQNGKIVINTILRNMLENRKIDLSNLEKDMQSLYESINLSNTLLILEDVERTGINILELMGYVNNLVEHDNAKVLLVAKEDTFLKTEQIQQNINESNLIMPSFSEYTDETKKYLELKEKTVSDTIEFVCNVDDALSNILDIYNNELGSFNNEENLKEIKEIIPSQSNINLRTFQFACQKASDIFSLIEKNSIKEEIDGFEKIIFYSVIIFSYNLKANYIPKWAGSEFVSSSLGSNDYPLFRFCYNYICFQDFNKDLIKPTIKEYKNIKLYNTDRYKDDKDLFQIENWHTYTEKEIRECINRIKSRIDSADSIAFYSYAKLANYLISISDALGEDVFSCCKEKMLKNIESATEEISFETMFIYEIDEQERREKLMKFKEEAKEAYSRSKKNTIDFDYSQDKIEDLLSKVRNMRFNIYNKQRFLSQLDLDRLSDMIFECEPIQIYNFRECVHIVYTYHSSDCFFSEEQKAIEEFLDKIKLKLERIEDKFDKISLLQIKCLCNDIKNILSTYLKEDIEVI